ncbi:hypothetical protein GCM10007874_62330 [Labrys miyagiensis]|uniref:Uncharacterized protein n=1 Tax=Labrys miyagiensis TaxID=346912 RepID=A0ABQ6CTT5_9HYPH|nr:hypothetical protein GCM10007874_62330 [Labrys miyagiensis]
MQPGALSSTYYASTYKAGTLREKLFGAGPYLPQNHPALAFRDIEAVKRRETAEWEAGVQRLAAGR